MSNKVILRPHNFIPYTLVPNFFIDRFLTKANGEFIKVYLVLLRYMSIGQLDFDLSQIADHLLMTESDVLRALNYFQSEGLLTLMYSGNRLQEIHLSHLTPKDTDLNPVLNDNKSDYQMNKPMNQEYNYSPGANYESSYNDHNYIQGNNNQNQVQGNSNQNQVQGNSNQNQVQGNSNQNQVNDAQNHVQGNNDQSYVQGNNPLNLNPRTNNVSNFLKPQVKDIPESNLKVISNRPEYTNKEVAVFAEDKGFNQLLYIVQKYLGKTLNSNEVKTIVSFHDWLGLPIDVIELLIEYCVDNDHRNMRYIEKVAIDWADNEINTIEKAKVRTETYNKSYFVILKAYGITDRSPTPNQIKLMDKWLNDYQFDISIIVEACERTIAQINKAEMRYTDTILETWAKEGVKSINDITDLDRNRPTKTFPKTNANTNSNSNKFSNYKQREYDYDELERKALELRLKESNGKRYSG